MRARRSGFTLLEVLIALAIVATLAVLGYRALSAMSESETRLAAEAERWRTLDLFFSRLEGDLRQAIPRAARLDQAREPAWLAGASDDQGNATIAFSRAGPEFNVEPGSGGQRLQYRFREGTIEVLYWPGYDRVRATAPRRVCAAERCLALSPRVPHQERHVGRELAGQRRGGAAAGRARGAGARQRRIDRAMAGASMKLLWIASRVPPPRQMRRRTRSAAPRYCSPC